MKTKMKNLLRRTGIILVTLSLCFAAFAYTSRGQTAEYSTSSENLKITVFINDLGKEFIVKNLEMSFENATCLPLNTSLPAFNDHFQGARFSDAGEGVFLRVSYDAVLNTSKAETYGDVVLGELLKSFNLPLNIAGKNHVVNNETASVDICYQFSGVAWRVEDFEELLKYSPKEGFGQLVTRDLLSFYFQDNPNIENEEYHFYGIEYTLTRIDEALVWRLSLSGGHRVRYQEEDHIDVSLNGLSNHSGSINPSAQRPSRVSVYIYRKEFTGENPLLLSFSSSSPPYTDLKEESDYVTVGYNLTDPVDDVVVRIDIAPETAGVDPNVIYGVIAVIVVCVALVLALVFVRRRGKSSRAGTVESLK